MGSAPSPSTPGNQQQQQQQQQQPQTTRTRVREGFRSKTKSLKKRAHDVNELDYGATVAIVYTPAPGNQPDGEAVVDGVMPKQLSESAKQTILRYVGFALATQTTKESNSKKKMEKEMKAIEKLVSETWKKLPEMEGAPKVRVVDL